MPSDIIMPRLGLTMEEGTVVRWLAREGEHVVQGTPLLEVETDKVVSQIEADDSGIVSGFLADEGDEVAVGQPVATLETEQ